MVAFIKGMFNPKKKSEEVVAPQSDLAPAVVEKKVPEKKVREKAVQQALAYFLDADEARTYGNLEYMQAVKSVKRTFPKTASQPEEMEITIQVSANKSLIGKNGKLDLTDAIVTVQPTASQVDATAERRRTDTSMDMFRNMARDIKKK